jgi:two-component system, sensor histidine kinase and response regulator
VIVAKGGDVLDQANPLVTSDYIKTLAHQEDKTTLKNTQWPEKARILLVEDNHVNQLVATDILEEFGLMVDTAADGKEAITLIQMSPKHSPYNLILMDCQMPNMDGYEATRQIRQGMAGDMNKSIAIVAMTANAMQGDREKCIDAGMDDYLSKPIDPQGLHQKLCLWLMPEHRIEEKQDLNEKYVLESLKPEPSNKMLEKEPENQINTEQTPNKDETMTVKIWDKDDALKRIMGKEKLLNMLIGVFNKEMPLRMEQLEQAVADKNIDDVVHLAHTIKGVAANLSGLRLQKNAGELELAAKEAQTDQFSDLFLLVKQSYPELVAAFEAYQNSKLEEATQGEKTGLSKHDIKEKLKSLSSALVNSEYIDPQSLESLVNTGEGDVLNTVLKELIEQINMFDFINAQVSLKKAMGLCDG